MNTPMKSNTDESYSMIKAHHVILAFILFITFIMVNFAEVPPVAPVPPYMKFRIHSRPVYAQVEALKIN